MASTRSRNTPGDYDSEQRSYFNNLAYMSYETASHYAVPQHTYFPGNGLVGMKAAHRSLSSNYCDVESQLFGIGSTNLVSPTSEVQPQIHQLKSLDIASTKTPLIMPSAFAPQANQRPMYLN